PDSLSRPPPDRGAGRMGGRTNRGMRMHRAGPGDTAAPTEALATQQATEALASHAAATGPEDALAPGTLLGDFRIEALLGRGGMGEVYRAEQLHPVHRNVALKLLRKIGR